MIRLLSVGPLRAVLRELVRGMWRAKQLESGPALPISLVAIDGKAIATDDVQLHPQAQSQGTPEKPRYVLRVLRAALVSTPVVPVLDQRVIPAKEGEANNLVPFVEDLLDAYGCLDMLTCFSFDAGFTSRSNLHWLHGRDLGFIAALRSRSAITCTFGRRCVRKGGLAHRSHSRAMLPLRSLPLRRIDDLGVQVIAERLLKGDQPTLHDEAVRILGEGERSPDGGWELIQEEQREARKLTLYFARTREMVGWDDWQIGKLAIWQFGNLAVHPPGVAPAPTARGGGQGHMGGPVLPDQSPVGATQPQAGHGRDSRPLGHRERRVLDPRRTVAHSGTQWHEDARAWVRQGLAAEILGILRCIAYNLMRRLRHRTLLNAERKRPWRELFELVRLAIVAPRSAVATAYS